MQRCQEPLFRSVSAVSGYAVESVKKAKMPIFKQKLANLSQIEQKSR